MAAGALVEWVRSVRGVAAELGVPVIVNDRPDVAVIAEADGVHLGQQDLRPEDVRERLGARLLVGLSTHSRADVESAAALAADYLGLGPVFDTATKGLAGRGLDLVRDALPRARRPAFAIGGITAANVPALRAAGAGRIAVSQAICAAADPQAAAAELAALLGP
jgi:thiamine-phosphate pyrophosphorylase